MNTERKTWLENAILDYISKHSDRRLTDIIDHFKLSPDVTMESLHWLTETNLVNKATRGISTYYSKAN